MGRETKIPRPDIPSKELYSPPLQLRAAPSAGRMTNGFAFPDVDAKATVISW